MSSLEAAAALLLACLASPAFAAGPERAVPDAAALARLEAQYAPVDLRVDLSGLPASERTSLAKLVEAARIMDGLFLRQVWSGNEDLLLRLSEDRSPLGRARLLYFLRNKGPWDRLDHMRSFVPGAPEKPRGADFYPAGSTRDEVAKYLAGLPEAERARAAGFFTVLRRDPAGRLAIFPYSVEYQGQLARAAGLLREAARATQSATLRAFLEARAAAFLSNDYYASDLAWMDLDGVLEPTIGPYEVYEDEWFNAKAAFEAFLCVRDEAETRKLARFSAELQDVEDHLPIAPGYRNPKLAASAPIRVVNEVFASGDAARGVATAAFNLPNDERIVHEKGSKRVLLRNVQQAKFEKTLVPIARIVLAPEDRAAVSFDSFFEHTLMHELMHGLGPHRITVNGRAVTVREELQESYSALEEAKADVSGLFALQRFIDRGVVDRAMERTLYTTYMASMFRSVRFGLAEAHGSGTALQLSWFLERRAVAPRPDGTFAVDLPRMKQAVVALTREIMTVQARGDAGAARDLLRRYAVLEPSVQRALERLREVPVDIAPRFVTAEELSR
jgi:Peptidase family M49